MALPLETEIMREIGLGNHYSWYNGSGSCRYIAREAARKLPEALQRVHDEGEEIAPPDHGLMTLATQAVGWDRDQYTLTIAWEVMSYVIAAHIHAFHAERPAAFLREQERGIRQHYLHKQREW